VVFVDVIVVRVRAGEVVNPPIYVAVGVTVAGERDILGLWAGDGGEGATHWLQVLTEIKNRGVEDVCILVCDGLKGLPDSVGAVWPLTIVQTCVIHVLGKTSGTRPGRTGQRSPRIRGRSTPRRPRPPRPRGWRSSPRRGGPATAAIARLWRSCWGELTPFLAYDVEIRKVICSTNAVESLTAIKCLYPSCSMTALTPGSVRLPCARRLQASAWSTDGRRPGFMLGGR
jgi:hypothetical protein